MIRRPATIAFALILVVLGSEPGLASTTSVKFACGFSHRAQIDPIVSPGTISGHMHDFFGNNSTDSTSTYGSMIASTSTCKFTGDTAAYWFPTLYGPDGVAIKPKTMTVYYSDEPQSSNTVTAFPPDFRMIAGYPHAFDAHPESFWGWSCKNTDPLSPTLVGVDCSRYTGTSAQYLAARIFFPMCGQLDVNGNVITDSADHRSHVAYPIGGTSMTGTGSCPADHPVQLPRLRVIVNYPVSTCVGCYLSSDSQFGTDPGGSMHSDFWNTWDQSSLEGLVSQLNSGSPTCSAGSGLQVCSFNPTSGAVGAEVAILGTGFTDATSVAFNGTSTTPTVVSGSQIDAVVPQGATTGPISVTTPAGTATSTSNFIVISVAITGFDPTSGPSATTVTIRGFGFTGATAVKFNGVSATFKVDSDTQITAVVPSGATTGPIKVRTPVATATSSTSFTVT